MIVLDLIKNSFISLATFVFIVWESRRSYLWRNEDAKKQFTRERNNNAEKLEENLQQIKLIPIIVEELFLDKPKDFNLRTRLISIKSSIEKLDVILSKDCKIPSFKHYIFILEYFFTHLEDFKSFFPQKLNNELYEELIREKNNEQYTKLITELKENFMEKLNIIEGYLSNKLYSNVLDFITEISKLQKGEINSINDNALTFLKNYTDNFLKLITQFKKAYINGDEIEINRIIIESAESKSLHVLIVESSKYYKNKSENELISICNIAQLQMGFLNPLYMSRELLLFYSFIKSKNCGAGQ